MGRCRDCKHYDIAAVLNRAERIQTGKVARCRWKFTYPVPLSVTSSFKWTPPDGERGRYMEPNEGDGCPTFEARNG